MVTNNNVKNSMVNQIDKQWMINQIDNKYSMTAISKILGCSKNKVKSLLKQYKLEDYYTEVVGNTASKMPKFRINNSELKKNLERFGPLYNVID